MDQMRTKSIFTSIAWGIAILVVVAAMSAIVAFLFPSDILHSDSRSLPKVGDIFSGEDMQRKELQAKEELEIARKSFEKNGFAGAVKADWKRYLPVFAAIAIACVLFMGQRLKTGVIVTMALPVITLMLLAGVSLLAVILVVLPLVVFLSFRMCRRRNVSG
jgi:hypothetical protein